MISPNQTILTKKDLGISMETSKIDLSIIIPVYNAELYLRECIDSILNGEYKNFEIILVDDGSKDKSPQIVDEYAEKYPQIQGLHQANSGAIKARKFGISYAKGNYFGFVDSDDWVTPITYNMMMTAAKENNADIVTMAGIRVSGEHTHSFQDSLPAGIYDRTKIEDEVIPNMFMNHDLLGSKGFNPSQCLKIFRKEIVEQAYKAIPDDIIYGEDLIFTYSSLFISNKIVILPKNYIGYNYRLNPKSVSWKYKDNLFQKSMKIVNYLRNYPSLVDNTKYQSELDYTSCFFAINAFLNEYLMENKSDFRIRKERIKEILENSEFQMASNRITLKEASFLNKIIVSLMRQNKLNLVCFIGRIISIFRKPITLISQKIY